MRAVFFILIFLTSCSSPAPTKRAEIIGRSGSTIYRIEPLADWKGEKVEPTSNTIEPIAIFTGPDFKLVIHNFPGLQIPAEAQIERWKKQVKKSRIEPISFSGYQGWLIESDVMLAIALDPPNRDGEKGSPVTLKVTGKFNHSNMKKALSTFETVEPFK